MRDAILATMYRFKGMSWDAVLDLPMTEFIGMVPWDMLDAAKESGRIHFTSPEAAEAFFESLGMET